MVAAAQAEEKERQQLQEEITELEKRVSTVIPTLEESPDPSKQQVRLCSDDVNKISFFDS